MSSEIFLAAPVASDLGKIPRSSLLESDPRIQSTTQQQTKDVLQDSYLQTQSPLQSDNQKQTTNTKKDAKFMRDYGFKDEGEDDDDEALPAEPGSFNIPDKSEGMILFEYLVRKCVYSVRGKNRLYFVP